MAPTPLLALVFVLGSFFTVAIADVQPLVQDASPLTPERIYLRSVHAMRDAPQPAYITFRENIVGRNFTLQCTSDGMQVNLHHGEVTAAYDVWFRTSDGSALSQPVGMSNGKSCPSTLLSPVGSVVSSLGILQPSASPTVASTTAPADSEIGPPIIASVHVDSARFYRIDLVGIERLDNFDVYHLKLRAYQDPETHPLTDLYIDRHTFLVREARGEVSGHYILANGRVAGVVDFDRVAGYWLVEHESFDIAANALLVHARMTAKIDGSNFATPNDLPGIVFPTAPPTALPKATPGSPGN